MTTENENRAVALITLAIAEMRISPPISSFHEFTAALDAAELRGREAACQACKELIIVGTDGCKSCEDGRVTMYTQGRDRLGFLHAVDSQRARGAE